MEPRAHDARLVENEHVTRAQERRKIGEAPMRDRVAVESQETRCVARWSGRVGDQFAWKVVVIGGGAPQVFRR